MREVLHQGKVADVTTVLSGRIGDPGVPVQLQEQYLPSGPRHGSRIPFMRGFPRASVFRSV